MNKLITAGWYRVRKNWVFWVLCAISVYMGIYCGILLRQNDWELCPELILSLAIVIVIMSILNVATEYSNHTMRNKLSTGHTKKHIFFAELLLNVEITCFLLSVMLLMVLVVAGGMLQGVDGVSALKFLVMFYLFYIELTVMVTVTGLLFASSIQGAIAGMVALFGVPIWIGIQLQVYFVNVVRFDLNVEKKALMVRYTLTHLDVSEEAAKMWQMFFDMLIGGQWTNVVQYTYVFLGIGTFEGVSGLKENMPVVQIVYSLLISMVFIIFGYLFFRKKEMK